MKITWNGEPGDPEQIEQYGVNFTKGQPVEVDPKHKMLDKFIGNRFFEVEGHSTASPGAVKPESEEGGPSYAAVQKSKGNWMVEGPDGFEALGPFNKANATAKATELNKS